MSKIKVDTIQSTQHATSTIGLTSTGATINGDCNATTFTGSGANLTSLPSANLTGALPAIDGSALTSLTSANLTGAIPANLLTNAGGGGGFEFVSKSEVASGTTAAYIDITNLANDTMYRIVGKQVVLSHHTGYTKHEFLDTSGNVITGKINYTRTYGTTTLATDGWTTQNQFYGAAMSDGQKKSAFILELFTKAGEVWFKFDGTTTRGTRTFMQTWGNFDSSDTTTQVGGLRIRDASGVGYTLDPGTQILLYKYKES